VTIFGLVVDPVVQGAFIASVPATMASFAAWRQASLARKHTETSNGVTTGQMVEKNHELLVNHISDSWIHRGYGN